MVRKGLGYIEGIRGKFEGIFVRFGTKRNYHGFPQPTLLLRDIRNMATGRVVADHMWFTVGKRLSELSFQENDVVHFDARVTPYVKGYRGYLDDPELPPVEQDYKLSYPTNINKVLPPAISEPNNENFKS